MERYTAHYAVPFAILKFPMARLVCTSLRVAFLGGVVAIHCAAQTGAKNQGGDADASAERGIALGAKGRCREALPRLKGYRRRVSPTDS